MLELLAILVMTVVVVVLAVLQYQWTAALGQSERHGNDQVAAGSSGVTQQPRINRPAIAHTPMMRSCRCGQLTPAG